MGYISSLIDDLFHYHLIFFCHFGRAADHWFKEAKERHTTLNAIIYGNIIYAHWCVLSIYLVNISLLGHYVMLMGDRNLIFRLIISFLVTTCMNACLHMYMDVSALIYRLL